MIPDHNRHKQTCARKVRHKSAKHAKIALRRIEENGGIYGMHVYRCEICSGWHIGHIPAPVQFEKKD